MTKCDECDKRIAKLKPHVVEEHWTNKGTTVLRLHLECARKRGLVRYKGGAVIA